MKPLAIIVCCLAFAAPARADINFTYTPGAVLYVRVRTSDTASVAVAMAEGTMNAVGFYRVPDASLAPVLTSASTGAGYPFKIFVGATPSTSANDPLVGQGTLPWSGSVELPFWADVTRWLGIGVTINIPGVPKVDVTHVLGDPVCN